MLQTRYYFTNEFNDDLNILSEYEHDKIFFKKGDYLKKTSEKFNYNYLITKGFCKVSVVHDSGEEKIIGYWGGGSIYPIICSEQDFYLEDYIIVTAMSDMETLRYNTEVTRGLMENNPNISYKMIDHYCKFTNLLFFCATTQTYEDLKTRICNILFIYYQNSKTSKVSLTQNELASLIGAKRESVVKILKKLREEKIIQTNRNYIKIISSEKLLDLTSLLLHEK